MFIAVSEAAGSDFPRVDTVSHFLIYQSPACVTDLFTILTDVQTEIQAKLTLPMCGTAVESTCQNDPHGFLALNGITCREALSLARSDTSSNDYQLMEAGVLTCPTDLTITSSADCDAAYTSVNDFVGGTWEGSFTGTEDLVTVSQAALPAGCSVQHDDGVTGVGGAGQGVTPHWNTYSPTGAAGEGAKATTRIGTSLVLTAARLLCKHYDVVDDCESYFFPNIYQLKELCPCEIFY